MAVRWAPDPVDEDGGLMPMPMPMDFPWSITRRMIAMPPLGAPVEGRVVELPGRGRTYVTDIGPRDAAPLFLLHAVACTGLLTWYPVLDDLAARYRVIVPDQRWHGQGIRSGPYTLADCADDVAGVADALGIDRFTVAGYSMGSMVAQETWRAHRDRVAGLVLCATTSSFQGTLRERIAFEGLHRIQVATAARAARLATLVPVAPAQSREVYPWAMAQFRSTTPMGISRAMAAIGRFDSSRWIDQVDVPTALVIPSKDRLIPPSRQRWVARRIENSITYEIDAGHAACVLEVDRFRPALQSACAAVAARVH